MAKAATATSPAKLLALLEKSSFLGDRIGEAQTLAAASDDARTFARQLVATALLTKWQATQLFNGSCKFTIGKYRLLDELGIGRIGREYLAEHVQLGRRVAVKQVSRNLTADAQRLKKFLAESRRTVALDHPHLVHSHDVDQEGQRYYVVTEFVDGEDLRKRVERAGPCSLPDALQYIRQAAEGLQHAAVSGVVHGDLKPANLLIDKQGSLKVSDLGFAKLVDQPAASSIHTKDSLEQALQDGVEYRAPEADNDITGDLDCRSDMYSLGQTLYFLLRGKSPPVPPAASEDRATLVSGVSNAQVAALFAKLTAPKPSDRPATWKEVLEQLRAVDAGAPGNGAPTQPGSSPGKRKPPIAKAIAISEEERVAVENAEPEPESVAASEEPQPFLITTNDKGRGRRGAASTATTPEVEQPVTEANAEPSAKKPGKALGKKLDMRLVLGVGIGGGVLLLLVSIGGLWMLLGGGTNPKQVVEKTKDPTNTVKTSTGDGSPPPTKIDEEEENPAEKNPDPPVEAPAKPDPEKPATEDPVKPAVVNPEPAKPEPEPAKPEPAVPEPVKPEPAKPEPPVTPEPVKPVDPPPPAGKPFEKLPAVVDLPDFTKAGEVVSLGELAVPPQKGLRILMHGGEGATRNKIEFSLRNANNETDANNWEVLLKDAVIAKLHREPDKLTFEWTPAAAESPGASPCLCNCLLQMTAEKDEHFLALRTPIEVDPITIDLEKGSTLKAAIENSPSATVVELVGLDPGVFPNPDFKTEPAGRVKGLVMWYGEGLDSRNLGLLIDKKDTGKQVSVNLTAVFRGETQGKDSRDALKLSKKLLPDLKGKLEVGLQALTIAHQNVDTQEGSAEAKESRRNLINVDLQRGREQLDKVNKAFDLIKRAHNTATVHVRISYDTGFGKVVLAQTEGAPPPEPLGRKPAKEAEPPKP